LSNGSTTINNLPAGNTVTGAAGLFTGVVTGTGAVLPPGSTTDFNVYCVNTQESINFGQTWNVQEFGNLPGATPIGLASIPNTVPNAMSLIAATLDVTAMNPGTGSLNFDPTSQVDQTGVQLALWHVEYQGLVPLAASEFTGTTPPAALTYAQSIVNFLLGLS